MFRALCLLAAVAIVASVNPLRAGDLFISSSSGVSVTAPEAVTKLDEAAIGGGIGDLIRQSGEITDKIGKFGKPVEIEIVAAGKEKILVGKTIKVQLPYRKLNQLDNASLLVRLRAYDVGRKDVPAGDLASMAVMLKVVVADKDRPQILKALKEGVLKKDKVASPEALTDDDRQKLPATLWLLAEHWSAGQKKDLSELLKLEPKELPDPAVALKWLDDNEKK